MPSCTKPLTVPVSLRVKSQRCADVYLIMPLRLWPFPSATLSKLFLSSHLPILARGESCRRSPRAFTLCLGISRTKSRASFKTLLTRHLLSGDMGTTLKIANSTSLLILPYLGSPFPALLWFFSLQNFWPSEIYICQSQMLKYKLQMKNSTLFPFP